MQKKHLTKSYTLRLKSLNKMCIMGTYINILKSIYNKPTASVVLNKEKLKVFPLRSGTRQNAHSHHIY